MELGRRDAARSLNDGVPKSAGDCQPGDASYVVIALTGLAPDQRIARTLASPREAVSGV